MSGVPYLGCKISLVSKSEIRYEGILYAIDTKDSTVALAKVRSFGTEERLTDRPVSPSNELYEYIIFRASDIKDLSVSEAAKPQTVLTAGLPNDPAIVQVFHSTTPLQSLQSCPVSYAQPPFGHVCSLPAFSHYPNQLAFSHVPSIFSGGHGTRSSGTSSQSSLRKSPTIDAGVQVPAETIHDKGSQSSLPETSRSNSSRDMRQTSSDLQLSRRIATARQIQRGRVMSRRMRGGRGRGTNMSVRILEPLRFDSEYDFEQANAEFQELETRLAKAKLDDSGTDTLGGETEEDTIGYNRLKSFYDNISCESSRVERGIPRFDWRIERKLNVETFGVPVSDSWFRRRRGRGGYRRGRGRGRASATASTTVRSSEAPKTVTFGADTMVTVETNEEEEANLSVIEDRQKIEEIPTIEIVVEKEEELKVWEGAVMQETELFN